MRTTRLTGRLIAKVLAISAMAGLALGCSGKGGEPISAVGLAAETPLPARRGTALVDGCSLDPWQTQTLARSQTRRVIKEVLMLCLVPRDGGGLGPSDTAARKDLASLITTLHEQGYSVSLGVAFTNETGARYDAERTAQLLGDIPGRGKLADAVLEAAKGADAVDLDLQGAPVSSRNDLSALAREMSSRLRPAGKKLGILLPPSVSVPSDLPDGEAFDRAELARSVDRFRVMTLDYSSKSGPTTDSGWAVDAVRLARKGAPQLALDVALPLYGVDFGPAGARGVSVLEARGLAATHGVLPARGPTGTLHFEYETEAFERHSIWYDDATSTGEALGAFATALDPDVGVLFYGLGAEDPELFARLAERTR